VSRPNLIRYGDLPISSFAGWDRVQQIEGILTAHDYGQIRNSAILIDAMERDDRISGVLSTRVGGLLAAPVEVKAANAKVKAARIARELGGDDATTGILSSIMPNSALGAMSRWGQTLGIAVAELIWTTGVDRWVPRVKVWHPQFLYWDWMHGCFVLTTATGMVQLPKIDENPRSDGKWFIWCPYGYQYGWLRAAVRTLAFKYLMRSWNYRDWARYNERYGKPIVAGVVPAKAALDAKEQFEIDLVNMGDDSVVILPQGEDPATGYDLKLIEAKSRGYQTFDDFKGQLDADIAIAVLGQELPSQSKGGSLGSAKGDIRDDVRLDKRVEDAGIFVAFREQVLTYWADYNFGDPELAPRPEAQVIPEEDETEEATGMKMLGDALQSLELGGEGRVDVLAVLERQGVPILSEEEVAAKKAQKIQDAADAFAAQGGAKAGEPDGDEGGGGNGAPAKPGGFPPKGPAKPGDKAKLKAWDAAGPVARREFAGLPIAIENPAGSIRLWSDGPTQIGATTMLHDYGYIEGVMGSDGEELDVYLGPDEGADHVHVVHQLAAPDFKRQDEDKIFLGFPSADAAKDAYLAHRNEPAAFGGMSTIPLDRFKGKLRTRTGTGKIRASAVDVNLTERAIIGLIDRASGGPTALKSRTTKGKRRAQLYADAVADKAKGAAARALAPDLVALNAVIEASSDFDDLRRRLPGALRKMDPARAAALVEKARLMAHLGGRLAAVKTL
jgi:phage gp29-like protein